MGGGGGSNRGGLRENMGNVFWPDGQKENSMVLGHTKRRPRWQICRLGGHQKMRPEGQAGSQISIIIQRAGTQVL